MEKPRIFIVDDNADTRRFLENVLSREFYPQVFENPVRMFEELKKVRADLVILDIVLPLMSGYDACVSIKRDEKTRNIPVIFLSGKNAPADIIQGLQLGAEDYVCKPFDYKELIARIQARLRDKAMLKTEPKTLLAGDLKLVLDTRDAFVAGKTVVLTETEFDMLRIFMENVGNIVSRDDLLREVWRDYSKSSTQKRTIDVHIRALRKKIPILKRTLLSIYGKGYKVHF